MMSPARQDGPAQAIGMGLFSGVEAAGDAGTVGHLQDIRHVAGGRNVQDGDVHAVVDDVQHLAHQDAGADGDRLARFQVDLQVVFPLEIPDQFHQAIDVVPFAGDVVAAPQVEPFHPRQELSELLLEGPCRPLQRLEELLAEGMEVQSFNADQGAAFEFGARYAEARLGGAGVIDCGVPFGVFRVDPQADGDRPLFSHRERKRSSWLKELNTR